MKYSENKQSENNGDISVMSIINEINKDVKRKWRNNNVTSNTMA